MERGNSTVQQSQNLVQEFWIAPAPAPATMRTSSVQFGLKITWRVVMSVADDDGAAFTPICELLLHLWRVVMRIADDDGAAATPMSEVVWELPPVDYEQFVFDPHRSQIQLREVLVSMGVQPIFHGTVIRSIFSYIWSLRESVTRMEPGSIFQVLTVFTSEPWEDDEFETYHLEEEEQPRGMIPATEISIKALERVKVLENNESCMICLQELVSGTEATAMPCSHHFHHSCITTWLGKSHFCPLCRFPMPICS